MKAQYKNVKFKSEKEFGKWLNELKFAEIEFEDLGQDLLSMVVDKHGEILISNAHSSIYCSIFVNMEALKVGSVIEIWENKKWKKLLFKISKIIL